MASRGSSTGGSSCLSCRTRKVRCDRILPQCSQCKHRSLECLVPDAPPRLLWLPTKTPRNSSPEQEEVEVDMHVRRQPLFRGGQQARNATDLLALTSSLSLGAILEQLDEQMDGIQDGTTASNGPFHVFRYEDTAAESPQVSCPPMDAPDLELWRLLSNCMGNNTLVNDDLTTIPWSPNLCLLNELIIADDDPNGISIPPFQNQQCLTVEAENRGLLTLGPSITSPSDLDDFTMSTARLLLDHYQSMTGTFYTPAPVESKTPWEILYIPNVLSTLGEVALTGNSSDAKVSLLFAVLAISAFSMNILHSRHQGPTAQDWYALGKTYRERATRRLQRTLRDLSGGHPKKEKYKNILMPLLSMVTISVVSGEMENAACYLSDIERIITLYGIPKVQKSRKVKMLHSIYLYLRVLTEGTRVYDRGLGINSLENQSDSDPSSDRNATTWSILLQESISAHDTLNLDFLQDLAPSKSTFEQIYSLPDSLFRLIMETTQLASDVDRLRHQRRKNTDHDAFAERVKKLEDRICEWEYYYTETTYPSDPTTPPLKERFPYHLTQAVYTALIIYFYRSVRDVNGIALQPYVQKTIYHLIEYDKHKEKHKDGSSDICWPGFIAGCEATSPESRQQISAWLEKSAISNGMLMFKVALQAVQRVWAARKLPGKQNVSWSRVLSEFSDSRVLVLS
ncbi:fungal-specific transcription factor domain-containing protein [Aspergillus cavernicola]|uniref:Fungal-specific transcription factor domain-containing protein n=1 Tax=Aspergillus cavernicola TaxID=176166 RepID=A0ABR4HMV4_9EURO